MECEKEEEWERARETVNSAVADAVISQAQLARDANVAESTVSRFRSGTYGGDAERIAGELMRVLRNRGAAEAIASGFYRPSWLISTGKGLRLVKTAPTLQTVMAAKPDAHVIQVWCGPDAHDIIVVGDVRWVPR